MNRASYSLVIISFVILIIATVNAQGPNTVCGDGKRTGWEECDLGVLNGQPGSCCTTNCLARPSTWVCRNASGICDVAETCNGRSGVCPPDAVRPASFQCASAGGNQCKSDENCDGVTKTCRDNNAASGTSCNADNDACTLDTCNGSGSCVAGTPLNFDDGQYCNGLETCDPATGFVVAGTPIDCDDGDSCTLDFCDDNWNQCYHLDMDGTFGPCGVSDIGACSFGTLQCDGSGIIANVTCVGAVYAVPEICGDGIDNDCDGLVDDGCEEGGPCANDLDCTSTIVAGQCEDVYCDVRTYTCAVEPKVDYSPCDDDLGCTTNDMCMNGFCQGTPIICNDNNECTYDTCTEPDGLCDYDPQAMYHAPCDADGNYCSLDDACDNQGNCIPGALIICPTPDNPCLESTCDSLNGDCVESPITGVCDDGLACTEYDQCVDGECLGSAIDCDDFISCTDDVCNTADGTCDHQIQAGKCYIDGSCWLDADINPFNPCQICNSTESSQDWSFTYVEGVSCNDDEACTTNDFCNTTSKQCEGGPYVDCSYLTDQCNTGYCDGGVCYAQALPTLTPCDDGNACTTGDYCWGGICGYGDSVNCDYLITNPQCQYAFCDIYNGCDVGTYPWGSTPCTIPGGTICSVGEPYCWNGACVPGTPLSGYCDAPTQCSYTICETDQCVTHYNSSSTPCSTGTVCEINGHCSGTSDECIGTPISCSDNNPCTNDYCDSVTGCYYEPVPDCEYCQVDANCSASVCYIGTCVANQCSYDTAPSGYSCSDGDVCNGQEECDGFGYCQPGSNLVCDDGNSCTDDSCDAVDGCQYTNNNANTCNDHNGCTLGDHCVSGVCRPTVNVSCADLDTQCVTHTCSSTGDDTYQCNAYIRGGSCDDGDACTENDICDTFGGCGGSTIGGKPTPPNECTLDYYCDAGVWIPIYASGGQPCTGPDLCWQYFCRYEDNPGFCAPEQVGQWIQNNYPIYSISGDLVITCMVFSDCMNPDDCNPSTGECHPYAKPDGTTCDDGDLCTINDSCYDGACQITDPYPCLPQDQCHDVGTCEVVYDEVLEQDVAQCLAVFKPDYTPCNDDNVCTTSDVCLEGSCYGSSPLDCTDPNICLTTSCDPVLGCVTSYNNGEPCDDNNVCTENTYCVSGNCPSGSGTLISCPLETPCNPASCDPVSGCVYAPVVNCSVCDVAADCPNIPCQQAICQSNHTCAYVVDDSNIVGCLDSQFCNGIETCSAGVCYGGTPPSCDDANSCTLDECDYGLSACTHTPDVGAICVSEDLCATSSQCNINGQCQDLTFVTCDAAPECWASMGCDPDTGTCMYHKLFDMSPCNDGNPCTQTDQCYNGTCVGGNPVICTPSDSCHAVGTCDVMTGVCSNPQKPNGSPCDDGFYCTSSDSCFEGVCDGTPNNCVGTVYDEQCQYVECDESTDECIVYNYNDGTYCNTGDATGDCSAQDVCISGACTNQYLSDTTLCRDVAGICDQAEYCSGTSDLCPFDNGLPAGTPCLEGEFCFTRECDGNFACQVVSTYDCSIYEDTCNTAYCDPVEAACIVQPKADFTNCTTGNSLFPCIAWEECIEGTCMPHYATSYVGCDDGNPCTENDYCQGTANLCISGTTKDCTEFNDLCTEGACDSDTGSCYAAPLHDGIACNADNLVCTVNDTCVSGTCVAGPIRDCSYLNNDCGFGQCVEQGVDGTCVYNFTAPECNPDHCSGGCTYTIEYWKTHHDSALNPVNRVPWPGVNSELQVVCGKTFFQWSQMRSKGNAWRKLFEQWLSAHLNLLNGACEPTFLPIRMNQAEELLAQCRISLSVYTQDANAYKDLTVTLSSYNGGLYGPGNCVAESCINVTGEGDSDPCLTSANSFYTRAMVPHRRNTDDTAPVNFATDLATAADCEHGVWDFNQNECKCHYGWTGVHCDSCAVSTEPSKVFLCVPTRLDDPKYMLRLIPSDKLPKYLGQTNETYPFVSVPGYPARYPGTEGLDCFCSETQRNARDVSIEVTSDNNDLLLYINILENDLGECEITWEGYNELPVATTLYVDVVNEHPGWKIVGIIFIVITGVLVVLILIGSLVFKSRSRKSSKVEMIAGKRSKKHNESKDDHQSPWHTSLRLRPPAYN